MKWTTIKSLLVAAILAVGLSACGPSTTKKPGSQPARTEQVEGSVLQKFLRDSNVGISPGVLSTNVVVGGFPIGNMISAANYIMPDSKYMIVDEEWFQKEFLNNMGFKGFLFKNGIENYSSLRNDCDDFSRAFSFYVRIKFRTMGFKDSTPAVGDLYYRTPYDGSAALGGGHAINVGVFLNKFGEKVIRFIEPQGPNFVQLDEETQKYYIQFLGM